MEFTDKKAKKIFDSIKCYECKESISSYPEEERNGQTDLDIIRDEVENFVYMFESVAGPYSESLVNARKVLRNPDGQEEFDVSAAKAVIAEYKQLKKIQAQLNAEKPQAIVRTLPDAFEELKKEDPDTPLTYRMLLNWCSSGELPSVKSGNRHLVDMNVLRKFLRGEL